MSKKQQLNELSGVPLWQQVADSIVRDIANGNLAVGDPVPGYRDLETLWDVSAGTAMSALSHLRSRGLISGGRGQTSKVLRSPTVMRLSSERYRHGDPHSPVSTDIGTANPPAGRVSTEKAPIEVAKRLDIEAGDPVSRVDYFWRDEVGPYERSTQWEPLSVTRNTPAEKPPKSGEPDVITRMSQIGQVIDYVREVWSSRMPTAEESDELQLEEGVPVMVAERTHYVDHLPVETADISIRSDRGVVVVDHRVGGVR